MQRPLWKEALFPTLLLGGLWLAFSLATTGYIVWLDRGYQRVVDENVASMRAAGEMQGILWSLHDTVAELSVSGVSFETFSRIDAESKRMQTVFASTESAAKTDEERREVAELRRSMEEYQKLLHNLDRSASPDTEVMSQARDHSRDLAVEMSARCNRLREINQDLIRADTVQRDTWNSRIGGARIVLSFLGPILGVWLGFRAAWRMRRRLAEISVRLEGASGEVGRLHVSASSKGSDLDDLDQQVLAITQRMDGVLQELHSARHEVLRSERLAAVGQLAAGVAHELRNPLTAVKLLVQTVAREYHADKITTKQLTVVQDEITRMERTIQSLLDFARPPAQNRLQHDLRETLGRAMNLMEGRATRDRVLLESSFPDEPLEIDGDPEQLHQVFVNLLLNSMDAMPEGGTLSITLQPEPPAAYRNETERPVCLVTVADSGSGIPEAIIEHLFEPFVTSKERGTGLGLAVSRRIIEEHGGTLTAVNGSNGGAVFSIRLPLMTQLASTHMTVQMA